MDWHDHITVDDGIQAGRPVIRGTRVTVQVLVGSLAGGMEADEVCSEYRVTKEQLHAALAYAADVLATERLVVLQ